MAWRLCASACYAVKQAFSRKDAKAQSARWDSKKRPIKPKALNFKEIDLPIQSAIAAVQPFYAAFRRKTLSEIDRSSLECRL